MLVALSLTEKLTGLDTIDWPNEYANCVERLIIERELAETADRRPEPEDEFE